MFFILLQKYLKYENFCMTIYIYKLIFNLYINQKLNTKYINKLKLTITTAIFSNRNTFLLFQQK